MGQLKCCFYRPPLAPQYSSIFHDRGNIKQALIKHVLGSTDEGLHKVILGSKDTADHQIPWKPHESFLFNEKHL